MITDVEERKNALQSAAAKAEPQTESEIVDGSIRMVWFDFDKTLTVDDNAQHRDLEGAFGSETRRTD